MHDTRSAHSAEEKEASTALLREHLARAKAFRVAAGADPERCADRARLREWQAARLARTHADLVASPRFGPAAAFFLSDLYGPKDFGERDDEVARIVPTMVTLLPVSALRTVAGAIQVDALSEELDAAMVEELRKAGAMRSIDAEAYAEAFRRCANRQKRELQIALIGDTARALDRIAHKPFIATALRMMRGPAHAAGLGELQAFLERGLGAFRRMQGAGEFIDLITRREAALLDEIWSGQTRGLTV
jgi:hypothetical protein